MKSTIRAEALVVVVEADRGRVALNGAPLLPHEADLIGYELQRAAKRAAAMATLAATAHVNGAAHAGA